MEILAIIPARGGSKGIPGKNIKQIAGKPLLAHTIEAALNSKYVTRTIVSTEDYKIKEVALSFGAEVLERPIELAQDNTKTAPVLLHVVNELENQNYTPELVVLLQATCPLRNSRELDEAIELFIQNKDKGVDSVFAAKEIGLTHSKWRKTPICDNVQKYECLYDFRTRPRRQDEDEHYKMYQETGATYIIKTDIMKKVKDFIGNNPELYTDGSFGDIDTIEDFNTAERILLKRQNGEI